LLGDRICVPRREVFYVGSPPHDRRYRWEHLASLAPDRRDEARDVVLPD